MKKITYLLLALILICQSAFAGSLRKTVTTAGTRVQLSTASNEFKYLYVCAETDNTGVMVVADSAVVASLSTRQGYPLNPGECVPFMATNGFSRLSDVWIDATVSTDGVTATYQR